MDTVLEKRCTQCDATKPIDEFDRDRSKPDGHMTLCKTCKKTYRAAHRDRIAAYNKAYYEAKGRFRAYRDVNREGRLEAKRRWHIRQHGITPEQFEAMLAAQGGGCAICGDPGLRRFGRLGVDHDHAHCPGKYSCGQCIRGVLCHPCNGRLSALDDDPRRLDAAGYAAEAQYLRRWAQRQQGGAV